MTSPDEAARLIRDAEETAHKEALQARELLEAKEVDGVLKRRSPFSDDVKSKIRKSRKPSLRTIQHYLCDKCDAMIPGPDEGFIIHGNIYVADPSCSGGLIGNNFPDVGDNMFVITDVQKTVLCKTCFCKALGLIKGPGGKKPEGEYQGSRRDPRQVDSDPFPYTPAPTPAPRRAVQEDIPF